MPPGIDESGAAFPLDALVDLLAPHHQFRPVPEMGAGRRQWFCCRYCNVFYVGPPKDQPGGEITMCIAHEALCSARPACDSADDHDRAVAWQVYEPILERLTAVLNLQTSRIGADDFLRQFDGGEIDSYAFYQGVSFALARIRRTLDGREARTDG